MPKAFCITGAVVAILLLLVFGTDLAIGFPFDRQGWTGWLIDISHGALLGDVGLHQLGHLSDAQVGVSGRAALRRTEFIPFFADRMNSVQRSGVQWAGGKLRSSAGVIK